MLRLSCLLGVALAVGLASQTFALDAQFESLGDQRFLDSAYDYELWVADAQTAAAWYVILQYPDGHTEIRGPHATRQDAQKWVDWTNRHTGELIRDGRAPKVSYDEMSKEPNWSYFQTYPSLAEAEAEAEWFESFGMLTDIRLVRPSRTPLRLW